MKWVTCHDGKLRIQDGGADSLPGRPAVRPFDELERRAVHELLFDARLGASPVMPAVACVRRALMNADARSPQAILWCDSDDTLYPPAFAQMGIPLDRLYLVRPKPEDMAGVVVDCLRCPAVLAVVATLPPKLSRPQARRMQLAAEEGDGLGILMRPQGRGADVYAATTRWTVSPHPGTHDWQRWKIELVHGVGRAVGQTFLLESSRASAGTFHVRAAENAADLRPPAPLAAGQEPPPDAGPLA